MFVVQDSSHPRSGFGEGSMKKNPELQMKDTYRFLTILVTITHNRATHTQKNIHSMISTKLELVRSACDQC